MLSVERVLEIAREEGVSPSEALALFFKESSLGDVTTSKESRAAKVTGAFQLKEETFKSVMPAGSDINDPEQNARAGIRYYKERKEAAGGDKELAAKGYFAGPNIQNWGPKTADYGKDFLTVEQKMQQALAENLVPTKDFLKVKVARGRISESIPSQAVFSKSLIENTPPEEIIENTSGLDGKDFLRTLFPQVQAMGQAVAQKTDEASKALAETRAQYNLDTKAALEAIDRAGVANKQVKSAEVATFAKAGLDAARTVSALGMDSDKVDNLLAESLQKLNQYGTELVQKRETINQKQQAVPQFLDNPIGWIVGQMMVKGDITQYNQTIEKFNTVKGVVSGMRNVAQDVDAMNTPKLASLKAVESMAKADLAVATAEEEKVKTRQAAGLVNSKFVAEDLHMEQQKYQNLVAQLHTAQFMQSSEDQNLARQAVKEEKKIKQEMKDQELAMKNEVARLVGRPAFNSIEEYNRQPLKFKKAFEQIYNTGGNTLGENPIDALQNVQAVSDPRTMNRSMQNLFSYVSGFNDKAPQLMGEGKAMYNMAAEKPKEQEAMRAKVIVSEFEKMLKEPNVNRVEGKLNPYHSPPSSTMLQDPVVTKLPLARVLTNDLALAPNTILSDQAIIERVRAQFKSKEGYPGGLEQAAKDLSTYFKRAMSLTNEAYNFEAWHLPAQKKYFVHGKDYSAYEVVLKELSTVRYLDIVEAAGPESPLMFVQ